MTPGRTPPIDASLGSVSALAVAEPDVADPLTASDASGSYTLSVNLAVFLPLSLQVTLIVVLPTDRAVILPVSLTVATALFDDVYLTVWVWTEP